MKPHYRIVRYRTYYRGQIWRWWFPFWTFMGESSGNWYRTAEEAEKKVIEQANYKETEVVKNLGTAKGEKE